MSRSLLGVALLLALVPLPVSADRIKLAAGSVIQGYVVAETADALTVSLPSGIETQVKKAEVASVEEEKDPAKVTAAAEGFVSKQKYRLGAALYGRLPGEEAAARKRLYLDLDRALAAARKEEFAESVRLLDALPGEPAVAAAREAVLAMRADFLRKVDVSILTRNFPEADRLLARISPAAMDREIRRRAARVIEEQADLWFFREDHAQAAPRYEKLLQLDPDAAPGVRMRLAYCRARAALEAGAAGLEARLEEILTFEPGLQIAHRYLGRAAYDRNDRETAKRHFQALLEPAGDLPVESVPDDVEELKYLATRVNVKPMLETDRPALLPRSAGGTDPWQTKETPHFSLRHRDAGTAAAVAQALDVYVKALAEEVLGPGRAWTPERKRPLYLYRYPEDRQSEEPWPNTHSLGGVAKEMGMLGDGDTLIADTLPHELVHVIAAERKWILPIWAAEGLALTLQRSERRYDTFYQVQRFIEDGREVSLEDVLGLSAMAGQDAAFYQRFSLEAWTVMDYLLERKGGIANFLRYVKEVEDRFRAKARRAAESHRFEGATAVQVTVEINLALSYGAMREVYSLGELRGFEEDWRAYVSRLTRGEIRK